jgi:hypothetical protein
MLVAAIQFGTGISSNLIGQLAETFSLGSVIQFSGMYALIMAAMAGYLFASRKNRSVQIENA